MVQTLFWSLMNRGKHTVSMNKSNKKDNNNLIIANTRIRANELRVIGSDGEQIGIMSKDDALQRARSEQLDLVLMVPNATPPVAKIVNLNKYNYELKRREKELAKQARANTIEVKEVKFRPNIGDHDLENKLRQAQKFIDKGAKVKITIQMRGRENSKSSDVMEFFKEKLAENLDAFKFDAPLKLNGNRILGVIVKDG